ncbi:transposable element Tcb2 transposase [Trichonephila clavipes]|nr:transposable element Tcb2 transposase [Trichonephila clavipes]
MSERGETDSRSIGSSDKFHATVVRRNVVNHQTRRLNHAGRYARRPAVCIPLTSAHKRARLNLSLKHQHWSVVEWANMMLSGESRGVMVWAGIMMDGLTDLHFFDTVSVTSQRYRDEVFEPYVCFFRGAIDPDFIFMDDNAPYHRAVLIDNLLETENIQRMSWPANSSDLNSIEHSLAIAYSRILILRILERENEMYTNEEYCEMVLLLGSVMEVREMQQDFMPLNFPVEDIQLIVQLPALFNALYKAERCLCLVPHLQACRYPLRMF